MSVREGFLAIGRAGIAHVREEMRRLETAPEPEHIHQTRVSLRRLRSVLTVFADVLPPLSRRHFGDALGELANLLGKAREWDVLLDGTIAPLAKALGQDKALDELSGAATARRDSAAGSIRSHVGSADFLRLSLALGSWFDAGIWPDAVTPAESALLDQPLIRFAVALLRRRHRKFVRAGEAVEQSDADKLHQLRIEAKKLRYTTEFLRGLFPAKAVRRYISALKEIQEILGTANDAAVAQLLVPQLVLGDGTEGARAAGLIAGWSAAEAAAARRHFARAWEEFRETKRFW
jgi:CHAD domain-containing protein